MQPVMEDLGPKFERATGHKLVITLAPLGGIVKIVQEVEQAMSSSFRSRGSTAWRKRQRSLRGRPPSSPAREAAWRSAVAPQARHLVTRGTEAHPARREVDYVQRSGQRRRKRIHFAKVLDRLGIAADMKSRTVFPKSGFPGQLVANGEAEIGVGTLQGLIAIAGIDVVGPLPGDLQDTLVFTAAILASASQAEAGKSFIDFLRGAEAAAVMKAKGMEPATGY